MTFRAFRRTWAPRIMAAAEDELGLDVDDVVLKTAATDTMAEIAAYGTVRRFSHPRFGGVFLRQEAMQRHRLTRIYENVEWSDPICIRFHEENTLAQNILVLAHSLGHVHLFRRNHIAQQLRPEIVRWVGWHDRQIQRAADQLGEQRVEEILYRGLTLLHHIDWHRRNRSTVPTEPELPERDLLWFLAHYAPLEHNAIRRLLLLLREEGLYFYPIKQLKWFHEGFCCYIQEQLVRRLVEDPRLFEECMNLHRRLTALHKTVRDPTTGRKKRQLRITPYSLGYRLIAHHKQTWDRYAARWRGDASSASDVVLDSHGAVVAARRSGHDEVMRLAVDLANDVQFLRETVTDDLVHNLNLAAYQAGCREHTAQPDPSCEGCQDNAIVRDSRAAVLRQLLPMVRNGGVYEVVVDGIRRDDRGLQLRHHWLPESLGRELRAKWVRPTLRDIAFFWQAVIVLHTRAFDGNEMYYRWDADCEPGKEFVLHRRSSQNPPKQSSLLEQWLTS